MIRSIRFRLTLWYIVLLAVILAAFCVAIYFMMRNSLYENLDDSLEERAEELAPFVVVQDASTLQEVFPGGGGQEIEQFVVLYDGAGRFAFTDTAGRGIPLPPITEDDISAAIDGDSVTESIDYNGSTFRTRLTPVTHEGEIIGALAVGRTLEGVNETLNTLLLIMAIAYPATLVLASVGGIFLASRALGPIDRVTQHARRISADDLSQRLDLDLPDDEVGRLARTFDEMLERLDEAFRRQRQFTADASHELRTPLTAIKGQVEVALNRERSPDAYREVLRTVNEEIDRLIRLVASLLTLARADAGQVPLHRERVDVSHLVSSAVEQVRPLAEERGIALASDAGPTAALDADEGLLTQLLLNLLDNAIKHTPSGGRVTAGWTASDGRIELSVRDTGSGIPPEDLPRVFDRFYRVDKARSSADGSGTGLGLSISRWIARAHGGEIDIKSTPGDGTACTVSVPIVRESS
jgi:heavy metal sensor kinase